MKEATRKTTKSTLVMDQIREDILSGALAPGEKLLMDVLKQKYGIGYSPLREALSRLAGQGLVHCKEQCGYEVASQSLDELYDIYQTRAHIDELALQLAIKQGDEQWEAEIVSSWHCFSKFLSSRSKAAADNKEFEKLQRDFLFSLLSGCKSRVLLHIHNMLYDQAQRYRSICINHHLKNHKLIRDYRDECQRLVDAVLARDTAKAIKISRKSWDNTINSIAKAIQDQTAT